jgi:hypothetical protein
LMVKPCASVDQMPSAQRRFPPPWSIEELGAPLRCEPQGRQKLSYVYFLPASRSSARTKRAHAMNDGNEDLSQTDEEILRDESPTKRCRPPSSHSEGFQLLCMVLIASLVGRRSAAKLLTRDEARRIAVREVAGPFAKARRTWSVSNRGAPNQKSTTIPQSGTLRRTDLFEVTRVVIAN